MADVYLGMNYRLDVSEKDMRLICLGLAAKLTRREDMEEAHALNLRLLQAQHIRIQEQSTKIAGALKKAQDEPPVYRTGSGRKEDEEDVQ